MSANFTDAAWNAIWRAHHGYGDNLSFFLAHCLLKFVAELAVATVVSVFARVPLLSPTECARLMKFGITFAHGDYSRGYEPVYMNGYRFYADVYLINVYEGDVGAWEDFVKQLFADQLILNPDRQTFIFLLELDDDQKATQFERFFHHATTYIFEFIVIVANRSRTDVTHHLTDHQRLIHMLGENNFGYYYWNSCLARPSRISMPTADFQSKLQLREHFSNGRLCPPKADKIRVRLSVWPPFVIDDRPVGSLNFSAGLDIQLITSIARILDVRLEFTSSPEWDEDFQNASTMNNWKALQVQDVDLVLASTITTQVRYKYFYPTAAYFMDSDGFCVPSAQRKAQFMKWLEVADVYIILFAMYVVFVPYSYYIARRTNPNETIFDMALYGYAVLWNIACPRLLNGELIKVIFISWFIFCYLMNIYYQAQLTSILYKPSYEHQVSNQRELANSKYRVLILPTYRRYFEELYDPQLEHIPYQIQKRIEPCKDTNICLHNVTHNRNSALCIQHTYLQYRMDNYIDRNGEPMIYCFKEPIKLSWILFHVNRNFPLITRMDRQIMNVRESGIILKWIEDIFREVVKGHEKTSDKFKALKLEMLRIWFYFYLSGSGVAILGFICEVLYSRTSKRRGELQLKILKNFRCRQYTQ